MVGIMGSVVVKPDMEDWLGAVKAELVGSLVVGAEEDMMVMVVASSAEPMAAAAQAVARVEDEQEEKGVAEGQATTEEPDWVGQVVSKVVACGAVASLEAVLMVAVASEGAPRQRPSRGNRRRSRLCTSRSRPGFVSCTSCNRIHPRSTSSRASLNRRIETVQPRRMRYKESKPCRTIPTYMCSSQHCATSERCQGSPHRSTWISTKDMKVVAKARVLERGAVDWEQQAAKEDVEMA